MSIRVIDQVWRRSQHKSGNLLVLLALADHADDRGRAWPGIPLLARKARLSERHARRCLNELIASGEVKILPERARSGKKLYQIQLNQLTPESLCAQTPATEGMTRMSENSDAGDDTYIKEPSLNRHYNRAQK
jgi:helix-turn-helix protein